MISKKSCGGIIFKKEGRQILYLVVRHRPSTGGHWDFPKGPMEEGESEGQAISREIFREVGLKVKFISGFREIVSYHNQMHNVNRTAVYFLCEAMSSEVNCAFDELVDYRWLGFREATAKLTYVNSKNLLKKANPFLREKLGGI